MTPDKIAILVALDDVAGMLTRQVARDARISFGPNQRSASAYCRSLLIDMKALGWVRELDDEKPVCWVRTAQGTAALEAERKRV